MIARIGIRLILVLTLATAMATMANSAAMADNGDRSAVTDCGSRQAPWAEPSEAHARMRSCRITWYKNIISGDRWQTVSYELQDAMTDGYSAVLFLRIGEAGSGGLYDCCVTVNGSGEWKSFTTNLVGDPQSPTIVIGFSLGWAKSWDPYNLQRGRVDFGFNPPPGF